MNKPGTTASRRRKLDTAATARGHVDLDDGRRLVFKRIRARTPTGSAISATNYMLSTRWQLFVDVGADFNGGYVAVLGPTAMALLGISPIRKPESLDCEEPGLRAACWPDDPTHPLDSLSGRGERRR